VERLSEKPWKHPWRSPTGRREGSLEPFRPPHNVQIRLQSLPRTPFRTVSEGEFSEVEVAKGRLRVHLRDEDRRPRPWRSPQDSETPKFSGSRLVASRNSLLRFLAPFVATWGGDRGWSPSTRHDGGLIGDETPEIATANFREFLFHALG
jgi:hypothetical protein